ncbi:hypothetical protein F183_A10310 [Bryobacterales bacterium F-183]|nr:hypothetical protein F183_A10310 [Bryobacterales bacterium F-183]
MLRRLNPSWLVALIPLWMIWQFGSPLPVFDDWDFLFQLHSAAERGELLKLLPLQANESRPLFPRLIALPLDRAFGGDLRARMVVTWLLMCVTAWLLSRLGNSLSPAPRRGAILLLTNALLFAPIQLENWLWGNQLMFVMPLPCLAGILYLLCHPPRVHAAHVAGACVLAGIATWSFANGLLCWVAVLACLALRRAGLLSLLVALAAFGINAALYFSDLYVARRDAWYAVRHPLEAIRFLLSLIGSPFALGHDLIAPLIGAVAVFALAAATWRQRRNATAYPFLVLAAYALVSLAVVTSGRLEMGASQAFASRYTTVAVLVYVALAWLLSATLPANRWAVLAWCVVFAMHTGHSYFAIRAAGINARASRFAHLCLSLPRPTEGD